MRGRSLTLVALAALLAAVWLSMRGEERFIVEGLRVERDAGGERVVGEIRNGGERAGMVRVEVNVVAAGGTRPDKETIDLGGLDPGASVPFRSSPHPGGIGSYSIRIDEGRNPYGN